MEEELKVGDKVYYVEPETDSEVECFVYKVMENNMYEVKLRHGKKFGFFNGFRLTKIDPPNWETLEENLKECGLDHIYGEKAAEIVKEAHDKVKESGTNISMTGTIIDVKD